MRASVNFSKMVPRKDNLLNVSDSRFEMPKETPSHRSKVPSFKFDQQSKRPQSLLGNQEAGQVFYDQS